MKNKQKWICILLVAILAIGGIIFFFMGKSGKVPVVKMKDKTAPVITIEGENSLTMEVGEILPLPAVTANDDVDGDVTKEIKKALSHGTKLAELGEDHFTTEVGGTYKVIYSVCDAAGNEAMKTLEIVVSAKTPEAQMEGKNDLSVLNTSGSVFYENFEKGPENELLYDNYKDYYTLTGMEDTISGNSLVIDYGKATTENRITFLSMLPYVQSGTWEISFDVKLVSGQGRDDFYIMYTPNVDKNVHYSQRLLLADMKVGEVRHIEYEKVIEVLEQQKGNATFFLCNSNLECGDVVLMFDNFRIRRTDLEQTTYIPTVKELEAGFTYDWSDEKYATFGKLMEVDEIQDSSVRKALQSADGFGDRVMLLTDDSLLNGILAANNPKFFQQGKEYEIKINYYVVSSRGSALVANSSSIEARGIRNNLFTTNNQADSVVVRYLIGRGEEEFCFYLNGYPSEVYIGDITFKLADRTDKVRKDYHTLTEKELYAGYTFDLSKNNLPKLSGDSMFIANYEVNKVAANLPKGYFKSGETIWINGMYELNLDFLDGLLKKDRVYDIRFRFYSDRALEMDKFFLLTRDKSGNAPERNMFGITELGNGMYELYTQFRTDGTEQSALFYSKQMLSIFMDSITVSMQDAKPLVALDKGLKVSRKIDFDEEWLEFNVLNSNVGYVSNVPKVGGYGLYVELQEQLRFPQLNGFTEGTAYTITLTTKNMGDFTSIVGMFLDENRNGTDFYITPIKFVSGDTVTYQFHFTANEKTKMFTLLNATPDAVEKMYITDVEILAQQPDITSLDEIASSQGYISDFDATTPALQFGSWVTELPVGYSSSQKNFYYINLKESTSCAMDFPVFDGMIQKGFYYTMTITGYLNNKGTQMYMLPMDEQGNYAAYKASEIVLADGQTQLTYYFNGGDYNTQRACDYLRLFSAGGTEVDCEMYISKIALKAVDYHQIPVGVLNPNMNKVIFPNVSNVKDYSGNAQTAIIINKGQVALIDGGENASEVSKFMLLKTLKKLGVKKLDVVILTHPHSDHYGALTMLAEYFDIGAYYGKDTSWIPYEINGYGADMEKAFDQIVKCMRAKVNRDGTSVSVNKDVDFGQKVAFGDGGEFIFYYSQEVFGENLASGEKRVKWDGNYFSLGIRYNTKEGYDAYFAGDSCLPTNQELLLTQFENCEIWQINHHGSSGPYTDTRLITLLDPEYAVVCGTTGNLKEDVKSKIDSHGGIEICYTGNGMVEFDLNTLQLEREYKSLTEAELYEGHTFDLSANNMPRVTSSYVDITYMDGESIKLDGQYIVNLEFLNGLIQKSRTYDLRFKVYAPEGISRSATYIQVTDGKGVLNAYHRLGFTALGNDMYEMYCQVTCKDTEKLFALYFEIAQASYIKEITVSMQDAKGFASLDEGITQNYNIDFREKWMDIDVLNTNAGYTESGLYAKINETLYFKQLQGFTAGRTYQLTFTTRHTGNFGSLLGVFQDSNKNWLGSPLTPMQVREGDNVTYIFIFTADETTQMFSLFNNNRNVEEEMYIESLEIQTYMLETVTSNDIAKGYQSDFEKERFDFEFGYCRNSYWKKSGDIPVLHSKIETGNGLRFKSFYGKFEEDKSYQLQLKVNQISGGNVLVLPLDANNNQIAGVTPYTVNKSSSAMSGEMTYTVTFNAPTGLCGLNLYCVGGTNEMEIYSVSLASYEKISGEELHKAAYVSDFASNKLLFGGSAESYYKKNQGVPVYYVKQVGGSTPGLTFDSFAGVFETGATYYLKLTVNQLAKGTLLMLPLDANNTQIAVPTYNVTRSSSEGTGEMEYAITFTAPEGLYNLNLYCTNGTNEMELKQVELRGVSANRLANGITVKPGEAAFVYSSGKEVNFEKGEDGETLLNLTIGGDSVRSFNFDTFNGKMIAGKKYKLMIHATEDNNPNTSTILLLPMSEGGQQLSAYNVARVADENGVEYTFSFTAPEGIHQLRFYYNNSALFTTKIKAVTLQEVE